MYVCTLKLGGAWDGIAVKEVGPDGGAGRDTGALAGAGDVVGAGVGVLVLGLEGGAPVGRGFSTLVGASEGGLATSAMGMVYIGMGYNMDRGMNGYMDIYMDIWMGTCWPPAAVGGGGRFISGLT